MLHCRRFSNINEKKECIPVGCVTSAAVAICWGEGCLPQCMLGYTHTPGAWAWTPPWAWAWIPPMADPQPPPLGLDPSCEQNDRQV